MKYYVADAFVDKEPFTGNPAGVCVLDSWPDEGIMLKIAAQNNLSETAFCVKEGEAYGLRWFTPRSEVDLCGHATLAAAFVIMNYYEKDLNFLSFISQSGPLSCKRTGGLYKLDFPARMPRKISVLPVYEQALGCAVTEAYMSRDLILILPSEEAVRTLHPDLSLIERLPGCLGVCVTAKAAGFDFVSRYFAPAEGIPEDPVTGSAHSSLAPLWGERLNKTEMTAKQLSPRGGVLYLSNQGGRVEIAGRARLYLAGDLFYGF